MAQQIDTKPTPPTSAARGSEAPGVSRDWLLKAARLPGKSLHLAIALQLATVEQGNRQVALGNIVSRRFGIDRNAKYRSLQWMENEGLVVVERKPGRSPLVTILYDK